MKLSEETIRRYVLKKGYTKTTIGRVTFRSFRSNNNDRRGKKLLVAGTPETH